MPGLLKGVPPCGTCGGKGQKYQSDSPQGAGSGAGCFPRGTRVHTPQGPRDIAELHRGDVVYSFHFATREPVAATVLCTRSYRARRIWCVNAERGLCLRATATHSLHVFDRWKRVSRICRGDLLTFIDEDGSLCERPVTGVTPTSELADVYNLIVTPTFSFIAAGVPAHSFTTLRRFRVASQFTALLLPTPRIRGSLAPRHGMAWLNLNATLVGGAP